MLRGHDVERRCLAACVAWFFDGGFYQGKGQDMPQSGTFNDLFTPGALFFRTERYAREPGHPKIDRLASILEWGICAPSTRIVPNRSMVAMGDDMNLAVPYDSVVFLHQYGPASEIYLLGAPGTLIFVLNPALPFKTREQMGENWPSLAQDEVYVCERVPVEAITAVVADYRDAEAVMDELGEQLAELEIPLFDNYGRCLIEA